MAFVTYNKFDEKANLRRDGYIVLSEFFAHPTNKDLREKALAFAVGAKDPNFLIELLTLNPKLIEAPSFKNVVQGYLQNNVNFETPEYFHLAGLIAYATQKDDFFITNGIDLKNAYYKRNVAYKRAERSRKWADDLRFKRGEEAKAFRNKYLKQVEDYNKDVENYNKMLASSEVGYLFNRAMRGYEKRANKEPNPSVAVIDKARAFLINHELCLDYQAMEDYSSRKLAIQNFLYPDAILGFYNALVSNRDDLMLKNFYKHEGEFSFYGNEALKLGAMHIHNDEMGYSSIDCE